MQPNRFLTRRRLSLWARALLLSVVAAWLIWVSSLAGVKLIKGGLPQFDFIAFWLSSSLAVEGTPELAYDEDALHAKDKSVFGPRGDGVMPWTYPPTFFFFVWPLSLLPLVPALLAWLAFSASLAFTAVRRICRDITVIWIALAFPATFFNLVLGQTGLLVAGLFAWGMLLMDSRPRIAGISLGLLAFKPHLFPLIVVALIAARKWNVLTVTLGCSAITAAASFLLFGAGSWRAFLEEIPNLQNLLFAGDFPTDRMQSVAASAVLLGAGPLASKLLQILASLAAAGFVAWLWHRRVTFEYKAAGLALGTLLATPYLWHYDLTLLGLALLWLGLAGVKHGFVKWEAEVMLLAWLAPLLSMVTGALTNLVITPFLVAVLGAMLIRHVLSEAEAATASSEEDMAMHLPLLRLAPPARQIAALNEALQASPTTVGSHERTPSRLAGLSSQRKA